MSKLNLSFSCGLYDRTLSLYTRQIQPEGIDLNYMPLEPEELFWRMIQHEEFDASEFSLCAYMVLLGRNDRRFTAIPVFPSRMFRHSAVFVNKNAGIRTPADLKGKRVGVPDYTMTATVWIRGFFQDDFGLKPTDVEWLFGGMDHPGRKQRIEFDVPKDLRLRYIGDDKTLSDMLEKGEIDALIGARAPRAFDEGSPNVARLWPNYVEAEADYFKRTGLFPIMHTVVVRTKVLEKHPFVAQSLCKAFAQAKAQAQKELYSLAAPKYMVPWYIENYERAVALMGQDYWPYGLERNRKTLEAFARYCYEQGLSRELVDIGTAFAPSTLRDYVI